MIHGSNKKVILKKGRQDTFFLVWYGIISFNTITRDTVTDNRYLQFTRTLVKFFMVSNLELKSFQEF